ncbi:hypothetical protein UFOVP1116_25 [uncultured Caudovirales phage]|uniref:Uncharacterized protein n=1 Tax=uncultured Caudovirales phage TaxID=2100421 RepID=A0A6J7XQ75_9CAUD|nr:hypothetical protein UFOVP1116_25 [uncultured Caudovirales phage]CAB4204238.1 hypothetical protein UFOVP1391_45 [uncultured Caudovirales phage]CAB4215415.1 hypothetical protein UFOVP1480_14 [uncultured Caudovirales phage]CAB5230124.1 hypothetical protein UFOVP1568_38 [uncultured Caudovirales phage]
MEPSKPKTRLVAIGRHMLSCLSANDYIEIGERRWHSLHVRAQEMLEDSRADSVQRVECMKAVYDLRDRTTQLAIQHGATLEGAIEVIEHACKKAKVDCSESIALMQPEFVVSTALALFGIDIDAESSNPK